VTVVDVVAWVAERLDVDRDEHFLGKAFPAEDSFLLGEVALFCFVALGLTGIFLGMFYEPSTTSVVYEGSVAGYQGEEMPASYVSVLHITYDVPFGMFLRRMHHWAAHLFVASIGLHMLRVFFTASYRNPREPNWVIGVVLALLAMVASYTGYALPFDEFASTATGIGYTMAKSVPLVGGFVARVFFGGEFPTAATIPRLYFLHVLVIPAAIAGLLALHMAILVRQKHTEAPRSEEEATAAGVDPDDDAVVIGLPAFPNQVAVSAVVFFLTMLVLSLLAGLLPVHNVAEYGPNNPASTPALVMPDWFFMWVYGLLKLTPSWLSFSLAGIHVNTEFLGGVVAPGVIILGVLVWPFVDRYDRPEHFTVDPHARPIRTAVGVAAVVLVMIASIAGMNNLLASALSVTTDVVNPVLLAATVLGPLAAGGVTYLALDRQEVAS
jgi:cytochrome b-561